MKKRTVIISHIDWNNHTAYVKNQGIDELKIFKDLADNGIELNDDKISDEELCAMLRYLCNDGIIESVWSIENHLNRDQKTINPIKKNIEEKLKAKGLKIIEHCDWTPSFSNGGDTINTRNYLTILTENISKKQIEYENAENDIDELIKYYDEQKHKLKKEFNLKKENLNKELINSKSLLEEEIEDNKKKIKQQNWYIEKTKEAETDYIKAKEKLDKEIERYKKGKEYNDNLINSLPIEIQNLINQKNDIYDSIIELKKSLNILENDKKSLEKNIDNEKKRLDNIKSIQYNELVFKITKIINEKNWTKKEALARFETVCHMYIMNGRRDVPDFEKEHAKMEGLSENEIIQILQKYIN